MYLIWKPLIVTDFEWKLLQFYLRWYPVTQIHISDYEGQSQPCMYFVNKVPLTFVTLTFEGIHNY